ncbi:hypothetical protein EBT25_10630 [bacterium]|nr:hypothetical protein [bacterium]
MPVKLQGAVALRKALAIVEPTLAKEVTKEIASFLKPVVRNARGFLPSNEQAPSGWLKRPNAQGRWANRFYDAGIARKSITYRATPSKPNRSGFVGLATLYNKSAAGAIYETAGRKSGVNGNFTPKLGGTLKGQGQKMTGRAMFRAFEEDKGKATAGVVKAIEKAAAKFNSMKDKV